MRQQRACILHQRPLPKKFSLDPTRAALVPSLFHLLNYMCQLVEDLTVYFSDMVFGREIAVLILRELRINRDEISVSPGGMKRFNYQEGDPLLELYCWDDIRQTVSAQLSNDMPKRLFEPYLVLLHPDLMFTHRDNKNK